MLGGPCVRLSPLSCSLRWPYAFIIIKGLLFSYAKERLVSPKVPVFSGLTLSLNPEYFPLPGSLCLWQWEINQALSELDLFLPHQSQESGDREAASLHLNSVEICSIARVPGGELTEEEESPLRR